jgi:hypothetical protein
MSGSLAQLVRCRRGVAAVEFALVCSLLLLLLGGIADFGLALWAKSRLANAVAQGLQYAYLDPSVPDGVIKDLVEDSSSLAGVVAMVTRHGCYCIEDAPPRLGNSSVNCNSTCPSDNAKAGTYVSITATYSFNAILPGFSTMAATTTVTEAATARIK